MRQIELAEQARTLASRPYSILIEHDETTDDTPIFVASNPDLPGCMAQGSTIEEAITELESAREDYILSLLEDRLPVPEPSKQKV